jgi:molecular chaperone GrpE
MASPTDHSTTQQDRPTQAEAGQQPRGGEEQGGGGRDQAAADTPTTEATSPQQQVDSDAELARLEDRWRRSVADLDNLRKRYTRELDRERNQERSRVSAAWLPLVDDLERALAYEGGNEGPVIQGVRTILGQAARVLERLGFRRDAETGVPFDPARHEVVGVIDAPDAAPGTVLEVLRAGYGEGPNQLRPAAVVVSRREE